MFKPLLAAPLTDVADVKFPVLASYKFDGVRAIVRDGVVLSRSLKPIPNQYVQRLFSHLEGLDGELIVGAANSPTVYRETTSAVMRREGEPEVRFFVFDDVSAPEIPFFARLNPRISDAEDVVPVTHVLIQNPEELDAFEAEALGAGYEGVMLRSFDGRYKYGRSTLREGILLKLKRFSDSEAEIVGLEERMHNTNEQTRDELGHAKRSSAQDGLVPAGTMGALLVRDIHTGVEFSIGTGFTDADRADFWANRHRINGLIVKYKHFSVGGYDKPRFPTYLGIRSAEDMS